MLRTRYKSTTKHLTFETYLIAAISSRYRVFGAATNSIIRTVEPH